MRRLLPLVLLAVFLVGCSNTLGLVRVTTVDGNRITGVVRSERNDAGQMTIVGNDGSEYRLKYRNIKVIERLGDAPVPPPTMGPLPPGGLVTQDPNAPAEAPPPPIP